MERLVKRELIALAVAFAVFPVLITIGLEPANLPELLAGMAVAFFWQFTTVYLWLIPLAFGAVTGLLWHGIAEMLRKEYDEPSAVD